MKVDCCLFVNVHLSILLIRAIILIFVGVDILPMEFPELLVSPYLPSKSYLFFSDSSDDELNAAFLESSLDSRNSQGGHSGSSGGNV